MAISPMDIHLKEFTVVTTGGYDKEEVDSFLDAVAEELERLTGRNQELEEIVAAMRQKVAQFDEMQKTLQTALTNAQKSAGNILQEARNQAAAIIKKAQERSGRILEEMEKERERILSSINSIREQIIEQIPRMKELLEKSRSLINEYEEYTRRAEIPASKEAPSEEAPSEEAPSATASEVLAGEEVEEPITISDETRPEAEEAIGAEKAAQEEEEEEKEKYVWD